MSSIEDSRPLDTRLYPEPTEAPTGQSSKKTYTHNVDICVRVVMICVYVTLNKFRCNSEYFSYVVSSHFLLWIDSDSSSCADQFSAIASHALPMTN